MMLCNTVGEYRRLKIKYRLHLPGSLQSVTITRNHKINPQPPWRSQTWNKQLGFTAADWNRESNGVPLQIDYFSIESDWKFTPGNSNHLAEKRLMSLAFQIEFIELEIPFFAFTDVMKCNWYNTMKSTAQWTPICQKLRSHFEHHHYDNKQKISFINFTA